MKSFHLLPLLLVCILSGQASYSQVYEKVYSFSAAGREEGAFPRAKLLLASDGNFYGTTSHGGTNGYGTVFKMTPAGVRSTLVNFTYNGSYNKGSQPWGALIEGRDGNFYGTTACGGLSDSRESGWGFGFSHGTIFKMTPAGKLTTLVLFTGNGASNRGGAPVGALVEGSDGNFYGTTIEGGTSDTGTGYYRQGYGTVFKMTPSGELTTLVDFTSQMYPGAGLVEGSDGNFYGIGSNGNVFKVTPAGEWTTLANVGYGVYAALVEGRDASFYGTRKRSGEGGVFKVSPSGVVTTLAVFETQKLSEPVTELVQGADGNFYGTTIYGGCDGYGVAYGGAVFKITPAGQLTILKRFRDGLHPQGGLVLGPDGNFYGTTANPYMYDSVAYPTDSGKNSGTIFTMTPIGQVTTLVEFNAGRSSNHAGRPEGGLVAGSDGNLYGTTYSGGAYNYGTVFKLSPGSEMTTLVDFDNDPDSNKGAYPLAALSEGDDGTFYGTTGGGGTFGNGTVFRMTATGELTTLVNFTGSGATTNGVTPRGALFRASDGNFYGTTSAGGTYGGGTVFRMTSAGLLTTLVEFGSGAAVEGVSPYAGLVAGRDGNFYGTTGSTIFRMTDAGELTTMAGGGSRVELVQDPDGNFYGTTELGGAYGIGTVFKMTPGGELSTLVHFTNNGTTNRGSYPTAGLVRGPDGNFYGATLYGGKMTYGGTLFRMTPAGELTTIFDFSDDPLEISPNTTLVRGSDGNLYGTSTSDFMERRGAVFRLVFPGAPNVIAFAPESRSSTSVVAPVKINARGFPTAGWLEYGTDGVAFQNSVPVTDGLSGYETRLFTIPLTGLTPGTTYYYRFSATSSAGTTVSPVRSFTTLAAPLAAVTAPSEVTPTSARFNGTVNARSYDSTVIFEWGTDGNSFPNTVAAVPETVTGNTSVAVSAAVAGLTKGTTYSYRLRASNVAGTVFSGSREFKTVTEPLATVGPPSAVTSHSATLHGTVNAMGALTSVVFEYGTDGVNFPDSVGAAPAAVSGEAPVPVSATLIGLNQGTTYYYRVRGSSAGGVGVSPAAALMLDILSGFAQAFPAAPPEANGFLFVSLSPSGIGEGWRFVGEQQWRGSNFAVGGLPTCDREVEFRPVPGYIQPPRETVTVTSGGAATLLERVYYEAADSGSGGLTVTLKPDSVADPLLPIDQRAQWRFLGDDDTQWRENNATANGLAPGNYLVECKAVAGRTTPRPANVRVQDGQTAAVILTYYLAGPSTGTAPSVLPFETVFTSQDRPYAYAGQILSDVGASSGFVVKARVVATAGHVVFDDGSLSAATGLQWLFQRDRSSYEPAPQVPRGFYLFDGYAAQRDAEHTPGTSSPASQELDAAALYFNEDAGRGGFGGYLASDALTNEFLMSAAQKMLIGYPVDGVPAAHIGRMHATPAANIGFEPGGSAHTYITDDIRSFGGNSGGPLCIQHETGAWYPAAIYLGGSGQTVVRAIDSAVIQLFDAAADSAATGNNNTGGGVTLTSVTTYGSASSPGALKVLIEPAGAVSAGAGWRLAPETTYRASGVQKSGLTPGSYVLQMVAVAGYDAPAVQNLTVAGGQLTTVIYTYTVPPTPQELWRMANFGSMANDGISADNSDPDGDGFSNAAEYIAGTNPNSRSDHFKANNPVRSGNRFSVDTPGKAGRTYILECSGTLVSGSWTIVATQGPLAYDVAVTLSDLASPAGRAFYRIRVTGP